MLDRNTLERGWKYIGTIEGAQLGDFVGHDYIAKVADAIDKLEQDINAYAGSRKGIPQLAGDLAEDWVADTFNIKAIAAGSLHKAAAVKSHGHASVDVSTNFGKDYSLKYIKTAEKSVKAQAKNVIQDYYEYLNKAKSNLTQSPLTLEEYIAKYGYTYDLENLLLSVYRGQGRIIPSDQLQAGIQKLQDLIIAESAKEGIARTINLRNLEETLLNLSDRIQDGKGIESLPLSKEEAHAIAQLCKTGSFKPEDFGISLGSEITQEYLLSQALKGGITAAVVTIAIQLVPKLIDLLSLLIKDGIISIQQFKEFGLSSIETGAKSFIIGGLSCGLYTTCASGMLGSQLSNLQPGVVGTVVALAFNIMLESLNYTRGKTNILEYKQRIIKDLIVSIASFAGGSIAVALLPEANALAFVIGSMLGSVTASLAISFTEDILVSFCVDTGFTLFGLVKQDYFLPDDVFIGMGLNIRELEKIPIERATLARANPSRAILNKPNLNRVEIQIIKRGLISFHTIGYVF